MSQTPMTRSGFCEHPANGTYNGLTSHEFCAKMDLRCTCECGHGKKEEEE